MQTEPASHDVDTDTDDADVDTDPVVDAVAESGIGTRPSLDTRVWVWAALVFVAVSAGRWAFSADRDVYHVSPDEPSQLAIARWLAGDRRWNMFDHATWQPGLGTLLTPVYWFTDDPTTVVRSALTINAVLGGFAGALLVVLARRVTGMAPALCAAFATLIALAPSSLSATSFVWAEGLVALAFIAVLVALVEYSDTDRLAWGVAAALIAVAGFTSHSRLLPFVATTALLTVGREVVRRRWQRFAVLGTAVGVGLVASEAWTRYILANVWDDPSDQNTVGAVWDRVQQPFEVAESALGQVWYQLAATVGVAMLGTVVLVRSLRRETTGTAVPDPTSDRFGRERIRRSHAWLILASTLPLIGTSMVFMSDRSRADQLIYGRYNDAVMWPVLMLGLMWLSRRVVAGFARRDVVLVVVTVAATVGSGLAIDALHGDTIRDGYGVRSMIAGLLPFVDGGDILDVAAVTPIAASVFLAVVIAVRLATLGPLPVPVRAGIVILTAVAAIGAMFVVSLRLEHVADKRLNGWEPASIIGEIDALLPDGASVGVKTVSNSEDPIVKWVPQRQRYQLYQLFLPERDFLRDRGLDDDVGPYVLAPLQDPELLEAGAELIWKDQRGKLGLWVEPDA